MSASLSALNNIQSIRTGKYSHAVLKNNKDSASSVEPNTVVSTTNTSKRSGNKKAYVFKHIYFVSAIFAMVILSLVVMNMRLFKIIQRDYFTQKQALDEISKLNKKIQTNELYFGQLNAQMQDSAKSLRQIEEKIQKVSLASEKIGENTEAQETAVSNLVKAKNVLFSRVSNLESKLETINSKGE
jgi:septal ring factor EnvC (AmiA/AmiB activator)